MCQLILTISALAFSRAAFLLSWAWIALSILATSFTLERGVTENTLRQKSTVHRWYLASGNTSSTASSIVPNYQFDPIQATVTKPLEKADPTGLALLHSLDCAKNLTVSVLVHCNSCQDGHIFKLSGPVAPKRDLIHTDIWIETTLQRTIPPIFNVHICLLV